ncbi:hypothetical protein [Streptomyces sp. TRM68367]|uniref:hypothetical protein n=1 Tax=Streptomyces sp. TRM68367 TaxID=2758415 RepID=UPI00165AF1AC|nr:hypothetical protein [Streptomyces sp. TRM68367]MBC9731230.1 hypothetical protein [Streptomyces sp. TRM68367]
MTTDQDSDEAAVLTTLRRLGVGPRGGGPDDAPPPPAALPPVPPPPSEPPTVHLDPAATAPTTPGNRMPDWRTGQTLDLTAPAHQDPEDVGDGDLGEPVDWHGPRHGPQPLGPVDKHDDSDEDEEEEGRSRRPDWWRLSPRRAPEVAAPAQPSGGEWGGVDEPAQQPVVVAPAPAPAAPPATGARRLLPRRIRDSKAWMFLLFNGSAAAAGSAIGLKMYLSQFPQQALIAAGGLLALVGALGAGLAAWKVVTVKGVAEIIPYGLLGQAGLVFLAAEIGRRTGKLLLPTVAAQIHAHTGLDALQVALLIVGAALCGSTGFLVWKTRAKSLPVRWFSRIPLATAVLACALYAS